jgi:predicted CXXCH cytochrome family protein
MEKATRLEQGVRHVQIPANPSKQKACSDCHDTDPKPTLPKRMRYFRESFSHADHLPRVNGDCKRCHKEQTEAGDKAPKTPEMATCTACHNHQQDFAGAHCNGCHQDLKRYPKPVDSFKHAGDFLKVHGQLAKVSAASCASCHEHTFCADCHAAQTGPGKPSFIYPEEMTREFIHRGDYPSRHMVDAEANPASCRKCHGSSYCSTCHEQQNLTPTAVGQPLPRNLHPIGWGTDKASGNFHGDAARRNIVTCAGCHDQGAASTCVQCHRVGGFAGVSPHPKSWNKTQADVAKNKMCSACHT